MRVSLPQHAQGTRYRWSRRCDKRCRLGIEVDHPTERSVVGRALFSTSGQSGIIFAKKSLTNDARVRCPLASSPPVSAAEMSVSLLRTRSAEGREGMGQGCLCGGAPPPPLRKEP